MPILDFKNDDATYGKVVSTLLRNGCMVEGREGSRIVVTPAQEKALTEMGIIDPKKHRAEPKPNGKNKKKA